MIPLDIYDIKNDSYLFYFNSIDIKKKLSSKFFKKPEHKGQIIYGKNNLSSIKQNR